MVKVSPLANYREMGKQLKILQGAQNNKTKDKAKAALLDIVEGDQGRSQQERDVLLTSIMHLFLKYFGEQREYFEKTVEIQEECEDKNQEKQTRPNRRPKRPRDYKQTRESKKLKLQIEGRNAEVINLESDSEEEQVVILKQVTTGIEVEYREEVEVPVKSLDIVTEIMAEVISFLF